MAETLVLAGQHLDTTDDHWNANGLVALVPAPE